MLSVGDLRCEWARDPLGIDARRPRLSWRLESDERAVIQSGFELVATSDGSVIWQTGRIATPRTVALAYAGEPLRSRQRCQWRVRAWDNRDQASEWSRTARWEMALLERSDWAARWISPMDDTSSKERPCLLLRHEFCVPVPCHRARMYVTAHGVYRAELNGAPVSDELLRPGWTSYGERLQYQVYDVTEQLRTGANAVGVVLADGWWRGETTGGRRRNWYGDRLALLLQLEVTHEDGTTTTVATGPGWRWSSGPIRAADPFRGERYDARRELPGWTEPGYDDSAWAPAESYEANRFDTSLVAQRGPAVRTLQELQVRDIVERPRTDPILDFGQNMVGRVRLTVDGPAGSRIMLTHGEAVDRRGRLITSNLRMPFAAPTQRVRYTLRGGGETFEPSFSTCGFRYVKVTGWPRTPPTDAFTGVVVGSDLESTGAFSCSDDRLERLQRCIEWSQRGNFVEIPTDCPTRERSGWTGDLQAFAPVALFNMDVVALLERWLLDLAADQGRDGNVPDVIPWVRSMRPMGDGTGSTGWGDAATIVPMLLYWNTGDASILERQLASMLGWVEYLEQRARFRPRRWRLFTSSRPASGARQFIVDSGFHWGDHYPTGRDSVLRIGTRLFRPPELLATAFFARSVALTATAARVLGKDEIAHRLDLLHTRITDAFVQEFVDADGRLRPHEQSSYALALAFDLLPEELQAKAADHLAACVVRSRFHATTGFLATPHLLPMLADNGHADTAYALLLNDESPSWIWMVEHGATTVWESLRAVRSSSRLRFRSLNHYALGSIGDFLYRYVAGLDVRRIGLGELTIAPSVGGGITSASATYRSVHGPCAASWRLDRGRMHLHATVPLNVTATVRLPHGVAGTIRESGRPLEASPGVALAAADESGVVVRAGSGEFDFVFTPTFAARH